VIAGDEAVPELEVAPEPDWTPGAWCLAKPAATANAATLPTTSQRFADEARTRASVILVAPVPGEVGPAGRGDAGGGRRRSGITPDGRDGV
jgi:hypothetical protein